MQCVLDPTSGRFVRCIRVPRPRAPPVHRGRVAADSFAAAVDDAGGRPSGGLKHDVAAKSDRLVLHLPDLVVAADVPRQPFDIADGRAGPNIGRVLRDLDPIGARGQRVDTHTSRQCGRYAQFKHGSNNAFHRDLLRHGCVMSPGCKNASTGWAAQAVATGLSTDVEPNMSRVAKDKRH